MSVYKYVWQNSQFYWRGQNQTQEGQLKIYCNGSNRTKYDLNQNDGRANEKEVVDSKHLMLANSATFRMEQIWNGKEEADAPDDLEISLL